ncbi:MAG TPA: CHAD domain-containing protein [Casimicrobiaceae bacterium]|nr:CHAD domain-containing protein [Casimicrobiaceae bacterium]
MNSATKPALATLFKSLGSALRCFRGARAISDERAHDARKQLKQARAALRLLRTELGDTVYRRENRVLRDASRAISPLRDAKAQVDILTAIRDRYPDELPRSGTAPLENRLLGKLRRTRRRTRRTSPGLRQAMRSLEKSSWRLRNITNKHVKTGPARKGLRKIYAKARKSFATAKDKATPERLHDWRKKTKYLYNAVKGLNVRRGSTPAAIGKRAHRLGDWLGEEHDLVLLSHELRADADRLSPSIQRALKSAIHHRRTRLQERAFRLGAKTYADRPKKAI